MPGEVPDTASTLRRCGERRAVAGHLLAPGRIPRASGAAAAFRRHRDVTPAEYARRARRERAHREFQAADPDGRDTVAAVAARWGFADTGRFATASARTYDQPPVTTLRG
ncbi:MAG TPA: helix-turn-helix domain-containing protein [Blastococcus sp.]